MQALSAKPTVRCAARPAPAGRKLCVRPVSAKNEAKEVVKTGDGKATGFRWDPSMQRWIRDAKAGAPKSTTVTPYSGEPYTVWPVIHSELLAKKLKGVTPEEALKMKSQGWTLVDVRLEGDFEKLHAEGAVNVPLFRSVQGTKTWDKVKIVVMNSLFMTPTERNPDFIDDALEVLKKNQKVVVMCAVGGTLDTKVRLRPDKYRDGIDDAERNFGRESRSLKACHEFLYKGGWSPNNVVFMDGGYQQWRYQGLPCEASE